MSVDPTEGGIWCITAESGATNARSATLEACGMEPVGDRRRGCLLTSSCGLSCGTDRVRLPRHHDRFPRRAA